MATTVDKTRVQISDRALQASEIPVPRQFNMLLIMSLFTMLMTQMDSTKTYITHPQILVEETMSKLTTIIRIPNQAVKEIIQSITKCLRRKWLLCLTLICSNLSLRTLVLLEMLELVHKMETALLTQ
jgi:hypothetical protein